MPFPARPGACDAEGSGALASDPQNAGLARPPGAPGFTRLLGDLGPSPLPPPPSWNQIAPITLLRPASATAPHERHESRDTKLTEYGWSQHGCVNMDPFATSAAGTARSLGLEHATRTLTSMRRAHPFAVRVTMRPSPPDHAGVTRSKAYLHPPTSPAYPCRPSPPQVERVLCQNAMHGKQLQYRNCPAVEAPRDPESIFGAGEAIAGTLGESTTLEGDDGAEQRRSDARENASGSTKVSAMSGIAILCSASARMATTEAWLTSTASKAIESNRPDAPTPAKTCQHMPWT